LKTLAAERVTLRLPREAPALRVMGLDGRSVVSHDDRLLVRFQKSEIGMAAD
jgi:hypothetical protein